MKTTPLVITLLVLALVAGGIYAYTKAQGETGTPNGGTGDAMLAYSSDTYGIEFTYPDTYVLEERDADAAERARHTIVLMDRDDAANIPENGEGPTAITIDIFENTRDKQSVDAWIKNSSASNYQLSPDGVLTSMTVAEKPALAYAWDGLYRGNSIVFEHRQNIYMLSVTYMTPQDAIIADFARLVASITLK